MLSFNEKKIKLPNKTLKLGNKYPTDELCLKGFGDLIIIDILKSCTFLGKEVYYYKVRTENGTNLGLKFYKD